METKMIAPKGIVRNTSPAVSEDGQLDELVNLRHKDGSLRPIAESKAIVWVDEDGEETTAKDVSSYIKIFVHNASNYKHLLGIKSDSKLYWFATMDTDYKATAITETKLMDVTVTDDIADNVFFAQVGNLVTIADGERLKYLLFKQKDSLYVTINADFNGDENTTELNPEGRIDFQLRVNTRKSVHESIRLNYPTNPEVTFIPSSAESAQAELYKVTSVQSGVNYSDDTDKFAIYNADFAKAQSVQTERGLITGWIMVTSGIELYDGSVIMVSRPTLLAPPGDDNQRNIPDRIVNALLPKNLKYRHIDGYFTYPLYEGYKIAFNSNGVECLCSYGMVDSKLDNGQALGSQRYDVFSDCITAEDSAYDSFKTFVESDMSMCRPVAPYNELPPLVGMYAKKRSYSPLQPSGYEYNDTETGRTYKAVASSPRSDNDDLLIPGCAETQDNFGYVVSMGAKLFYRVNKNVNVEYQDIIKGYKIYMTRQVFSYDINEAPYLKYFNPVTCSHAQGVFGLNVYPHLRENEKIINDLMSSPFYEVASIAATQQDWVELDLSKILSTLETRETLKWSCDRRSYVASYVYSYNGKLHLANYTGKDYLGYPYGYMVGSKELYIDIFDKRPCYDMNLPSVVVTQQQATCIGKYSGASGMHKEGVHYKQKDMTISNPEQAQVVIIAKLVKTDQESYVKRVCTDTQYMFMPMITYPSIYCTELTFYTKIGSASWKKKTFPMKKHSLYDMAYFIDSNLKPINIWDGQNVSSVPDASVGTDYKPNGLKVSATNNPFYFPVDATYQIGNSRIIAMCANTMALSTGQWGDAPLYVFCSDGIYALFVDSTGQLTYSNSRPISREICNNANSVTPIDDAIVFTTERGLMLMAGSDCKEISQEGEGRVFDILGTNVNNFEYLQGMSIMLSNEHLTALNGICGVGDKVELSEYLKNVRIGYNYAERELFVTNPDYDYSYVYTNGYWTQTTKTCSYYISDYPKTYAKVGSTLKDINNEEATGGQACFVTRPIKFSTLSEKQTYRVVVRGNFKMNETTNFAKSAALIVYGSNDCNKWRVLGVQKKPDVPTAAQIASGQLKCNDKANGLFRDLGCTVYTHQVKYIKIAFVGDLAPESTIEHIEISAYTPQDKIR